MYKASNERYSNDIYNRCGNSGIKLPKVSLGFWHNFGSTATMENMKAIVFTAFDNGITHFDLANNYGPYAGAAEENFGRIMASEMKSYRDEMLISTKAGYYMWEGPYGDWGSRKYLLSSLDASLKRLGLSYVDIFYHHRPDPNTPLEETMSALDTAVKSGKALYAGLSNYDGETMKKAAAILKEMNCPFIINQNRYSILDRTVEKNGLLTAAKELEKGVIAFSPLEQGILTDRYLKGIPADSRVKTDGRFLNENAVGGRNLQVALKLNKIAAARGATLAELALLWVLKDGLVQSVLVGASKPEQILNNLKITKAEPLSALEISEIEDALK